jgi:hypothetical protein
MVQTCFGQTGRRRYIAHRCVVITFAVKDLSRYFKHPALRVLTVAVTLFSTPGIHLAYLPTDR